MNAAKALEIIHGFEGEVFEPHHPQHMWCGCIDGREKGGGNFKFDVDTIRVTEIAGSFPPYEIASSSLRAKFSFRKIKGISVIKMTGHSDCGGAQTAIAYPDYKCAPDEDVANIVKTLADTGADIPRLRDAFLLACEGNERTAANLLARHITLQSLDNVSRYPHVNDQIMSDQLDLIPLHHVMKTNTGKRSHLERYDVDRQMWIPTRKSAVTNMCERPHNCTACESCHATIERSLQWVFVDAAIGNGQTTRVEVPYHIARLFEEHADYYQPELHKMRQQKPKRIFVPIHAAEVRACV